MYKRVFVVLRGSFLVLSAPWHAGSPPGHHGASLALPEVRGSRQCRQTLLGDGKVKRMSDGSCTG